MIIKFRFKKIHTNLFVMITMAVAGIFGKAHAQYKSIFIPYSTVGFGVGTSNYYGDMAPYSRPIASTFKLMRWSVGANYARHFTPRLGARASFTWARIAGDDFKMNSDPKYNTNILFARNLQFRNDLKEFSLQGIFNLIPDGRSYDRRPQYGAYLFGGIAMTAHNPKALYVDVNGKKDWVKLQKLGTEGQGETGYAKPYSLVQFAIPLGIGLRYKINNRFDVSAELGFRFTFTDYLDDLAGNYADASVFASDPIALALSNRVAESNSIKKGKDRIPGLKNFVQYNYNISNSTDPISEIQSQGFGATATPRGNSPSLNDTYMTGMIHLHYIIPSQVKCPPLK